MKWTSDRQRQDLLMSEDRWTKIGLCFISSNKYQKANSLWLKRLLSAHNFQLYEGFLFACLLSVCCCCFVYIPANDPLPNLLSAAPPIHSSSTVFLQLQVGLPGVSMNQGVSSCSLGSSSSFKAWRVNLVGRMGLSCRKNYWSRHQSMRVIEYY